MNKNKMKRIKKTLKVNLVLMGLLLIITDIHSAATLEEVPKQKRQATISRQDSSALGLQLNEMAKSGNKTKVEKLIQAGADLEAAGEFGNTALMWAAEKGHKDIVKLLINAGANLDKANEVDMTALIWAVRKGHKDVVKLLSDAGANLDATDQYGNTVLIWAASGGDNDTVKLLIDAGANIDTVNKFKNTALILADRHGHKKIVQMLEEAVQMRTVAKARRIAMGEELKQLEDLPPVLIPIIDSYLPADLRSFLADYSEAEKLKQFKN